MEKQAKKAHALIVPYPAQGHLNPMLQFGKRLASKDVKSTLVTTVFVSKTMHLDPGSVQVDTISDGFDETGFFGAESIEAYLDSFQTVGSITLSELIGRHSTSGNPITCVVYDSMMPWILDVTKDHGLLGASFFTMPCAVNNIVYYVYHGLLPLPLSSTLVSVPGMNLRHSERLPLLGIEDMPSFLSVPGLYPAYLQSSLDQYSNVDKADFVLVNTIYELEDKVVDSISTEYPILTIGPTIPSIYLDKRVEDDKFYGLSLFNPEYEITTNWLKDKPPSSVVYVSFGSVCSLGEDQIMELAWALKASNFYYMWVIRASLQAKLPKTIFNEIGEKGIIVKWSPQLEVLANEAVGCFITHCGWNSTLEGLCLGLPMIAMP
ncbi:hypothetical protein Ancab_008710 [Ancistrocladus abbreviatus]